MEAYFDVEKPGSLGGADGFQRHAKFKTKDVRNFLRKHDAYMLHKPVRWRFKRRTTLALGIDESWQADLVDLSALVKYNDVFPSELKRFR